MNIELNTPRNLRTRQQYVEEITSTPYWGHVGPFAEVEGWRPSGQLKKDLQFKELCQLTKDVVENKRRIESWTKQLPKAREEELTKLQRMLRSWSKYNAALSVLRKLLTTGLE